MLHAQLRDRAFDGRDAGAVMIQLASWPEISRKGTLGTVRKTATEKIAGLPRGSASPKLLQKVAYTVNGVSRLEVRGAQLKRFLAATREWLAAVDWRMHAAAAVTGKSSGKQAAMVLSDWLRSGKWLPPPPPPALAGLATLAALYCSAFPDRNWGCWRMLQEIGSLAKSYRRRHGRQRHGGEVDPTGRAALESRGAGSGTRAEDQQAAVAARLAGKLDGLLAVALEDLTEAPEAAPTCARRVFPVVKVLQALKYTPPPGVARALLSAAGTYAADMPSEHLAGVCAALLTWHCEAGVALERGAVAALAGSVAELQRQGQDGGADALAQLQEAHACMTSLLESVGEGPQRAASVLAEA